MQKRTKNAIEVSIVIPTYNEEKHIEQCIVSIINQSYTNYEIIIVDDGSTDHTREIVSKYKVKLISIKHGGPGYAKNYGVKFAQGEILVFLDGDLLIEKNYIKNIIRPIQKGNSIATYTSAEYVFNPNNIWSKCWNINLNLPPENRISKHDKTLGLAFRAIKKSNFTYYGGFNPNWGYQDDQSLFKKNGLLATRVNKAICFHINPESLSEIFFASRWIGRSRDFKTDISNFKKYSFINSLRIGFTKVLNGAPIEFILFKLIFDFGILTGILFKQSHLNYSK
ncbi:MAG: glycosyltransferase family 2 protein [Patescibacteria group bacterium]|nr:glycosyltransferase family 2 protein [Patescibacteria group bacterium]